jgi:alkylation response protein AidB-like acyl-CoA dehydrogenase
VLAIRLPGAASFPEKIASIRSQMRGELRLRHVFSKAGRVLKKQKGARRRLSKFRIGCGSQQILAKQLALRELERPARLGTAVLLALDDA